jgi:hypothetical protein
VTAQLDLDLFGRPEASNSDAQNFIELLRGKGWVTAEQLGADTEAKKRRLRILKGLARGLIIGYPGSPGYKLLSECSLEELRHGDRAMRSQLRKMAAEWKPIWRRMHKLELESPA